MIENISASLPSVLLLILAFNTEMIKKILETSNIGSYAVIPIKTCTNWNGEFRAQNIIYGENGAGKTTLAIILTSLAGQDNLLKEKEKIGSPGMQKIRILM